MTDECECGRTASSCSLTMSDCCTNCQHRSSTVEPPFTIKSGETVMVEMELIYNDGEVRAVNVEPVNFTPKVQRAEPHPDQ